MTSVPITFLEIVYYTVLVLMHADETRNPTHAYAISELCQLHVADCIDRNLNVHSYHVILK